jgi:glutathione S-transferase
MSALATAKPLVLFQPPGGWGEPSMSPFCMKLECWLRMAGIPFEIRPPDMRKAPRGKIPYVALPDGTRMGDSQLIVEHLTKAHNVTLDDHLSPSQRATARAVRRMLEEGTYFLGIHDRWVDDAGWVATKAAFASFLPKVAIPFLPLLRLGVKRTVHGQGTSRHDRATRDAMAIADWDAIVSLLGEGPHMFGSEASSIDAVIFAFHEAVQAHPIPTALKAHLERQPALVAHHEHMWRFFPPERRTRGPGLRERPQAR